MNLPATLSLGEFDLVFNMLSLAVAAMFGSFVYFVLARHDVDAKYRPALVMSSLVVGIAGYHYWRIFGSWADAYKIAEDGTKYVATGKPFNDAYRYADWLLTVPLLVAELGVVLALSRTVRGPMMTKLIIASVLMIGLGYPERSNQTQPFAVFGALYQRYHSATSSTSCGSS